MDKTYSIYICDDNKADVIVITEIIEEFFKDLGSEARITQFASGSELEAAELDSHGICFLDIELNGSKNGIEIADRLVRRYRGFKVVFITGYSDKYSQAIFIRSGRLRPCGYITKPFDAEVIRRLLTIMTEQEAEENDVVEVNFGKQRLIIRRADIIYIESFKRKLVFHLDGDVTREIYGSISKLAEILPQGFSMCHRSFIVNLDRVMIVDEKQNNVQLENGVQLFFGATKRESFLQDYFRHKGGL